MMRRSLMKISGILALSLSAVVASVLAAQSLTSERMLVQLSSDKNIELPYGLRWVTSIANGDSDEAVVWFVDSSESRMTSLSSSGHLDSKAPIFPSAIGQLPLLRQVRGGDDDYAFLAFDKARGVQQFYVGPSGDSLASILDEELAPVELRGFSKSLLVADYEYASREIVALAEVYPTDAADLSPYVASDWHISLVKIAVDTGEVTPLIPKFGALLEKPEVENGTSRNATFMDYALDNSFRYLAVDWESRKAYVLLLRSPVTILEVDLDTAGSLDNRNVKWHTDLPARHQTFPSFSATSGYLQYSRTINRLARWIRVKEEAPEMALGLLADSRGNLFLLGKAQVDGTATFELTEIDPRNNGRQLDRHLLPFNPETAHVIAAPPKGNDSSWSFLTLQALRTVGDKFSLPSLEYVAVPEDQLR